VFENNGKGVRIIFSTWEKNNKGLSLAPFPLKINARAF
jgi:hypothetical protein